MPRFLFFADKGGAAMRYAFMCVVILLVALLVYTAPAMLTGKCHNAWVGMVGSSSGACTTEEKRQVPTMVVAKSANVPVGRIEDFGQGLECEFRPDTTHGMARDVLGAFRKGECELAVGVSRSRPDQITIIVCWPEMDNCADKIIITEAPWFLIEEEAAIAKR